MYDCGGACIAVLSVCVCVTSVIFAACACMAVLCVCTWVGMAALQVHAWIWCTFMSVVCVYMGWCVRMAWCVCGEGDPGQLNEY